MGVHEHLMDGGPIRQYLNELLFVSEYGAIYSALPWAGGEDETIAQNEARGSTLVRDRAHAVEVQRERHRALRPSHLRGSDDRLRG